MCWLSSPHLKGGVKILGHRTDVADGSLVAFLDGHTFTSPLSPDTRGSRLGRLKNFSCGPNPLRVALPRFLLMGYRRMNNDLTNDLLKHLRALVLLQLAQAPDDTTVQKAELLLSRAGFTIKEIAHLVGKKESTVGVTIHRAKLNPKNGHGKRK